MKDYDLTNIPEMHTLGDVVYCEMVKNLAKPGQDIVATMSPYRAHLVHMVLGICGEAGELLDSVKKSVIYNKPIDITNIIEELGDIEFYMEGLRQALDVSRDFTLDRNIEKLQQRYKDKVYSDQSAQERADKQ